jgi:hypothetical protein
LDAYDEYDEFLMHSLMHSVFHQVWKVSKIFVLSHFDFDVSVVLLEVGFLRLLIFIFRYGTEVWPCAEKDNKLVAMKVIRHQERLKIRRKMGFIGCFSDESLSFRWPGPFPKVCQQRGRDSWVCVFERAVCATHLRNLMPQLQLDFLSLNRIGIPWSATHKAK